MTILANLFSSDLLTNVFSNLYVAAVEGNIETGLKYLGAGVAVVTCFGSSIGQGYAAGKAIEAVSRNPEVENKIRSQFIIGIAIAETGAIYGLVVSILLLFVV